MRGHLQELGRGCWGLGGLCVWWRGENKRKDGYLKERWLKNSDSIFYTKIMADFIKMVKKNSQSRVSHQEYALLTLVFQNMFEILRSDSLAKPNIIRT